MICFIDGSHGRRMVLRYEKTAHACAFSHSSNPYGDGTAGGGAENTTRPEGGLEVFRGVHFTAGV